jgi:hypothetical protein
MMIHLEEDLLVALCSGAPRIDLLSLMGHQESAAVVVAVGGIAAAVVAAVAVGVVAA